MKKLLCLFVALFTVSIVLYGQLEDLPTEPSERDWEVVPNIISGGYSDQEGAYIYKLFNVYSCPTLLPDYSRYYVNYMQAIINIGYGDFQHHGGGALISKDETGEITKDDDETWAISYGLSYMGTDPSQPTEYTGAHGPAYVYKKESIQAMSIAFSSDSYTAQEGQKLTVNVFVIGGSGHYYGQSVKPVFLSTVGLLAYEGTCYDPVQTSISVIVKDKVTGQQCAASADIIITEKVDTPDDNPNNPSNPSNPSDPSDPSNPSDPSEPSEPTDPSNPDSPDSPSDPSNPDNPSEPDSPDEPAEPDTPDTPNEPTDPSNPDTPDSPSEPDNPDSPDAPDSPNDPTEPDEPVVVVPDSPTPDEPDVAPDNPNTPDEPEDTEPSDETDEVIIIDPTDPGNEDDEPTVIVINDSSGSDTDTIVVTDDSVTTRRKDNYDLAIFMSMFGAITGLNGSMAAPANTSMAVQEARWSKDHE
jgi:hypothetical protein